MLRRLADDGAACVLYSSDTEELVGLCDRVAVFHDGVPALMLEGDEITPDAVRRRLVRRCRGRRHEHGLAVGPSGAGIPAVLVRRAAFCVYLVQNGRFGAIEALGITNAALPLALAAAGETFVILTNGIDLSIGSDHHARERHLRGRRSAWPRRARDRLRARCRRSRRACRTASSSRSRDRAADRDARDGLDLLRVRAHRSPDPGGSVPRWLSNGTAGSVATHSRRGVLARRGRS